MSTFGEIVERLHARPGSKRLVGKHDAAIRFGVDRYYRSYPQVTRTSALNRSWVRGVRGDD